MDAPCVEKSVRRGPATLGQLVKHEGLTAGAIRYLIDPPPAIDIVPANAVRHGRLRHDLSGGHRALLARIGLRLSARDDLRRGVTKEVHGQHHSAPAITGLIGPNWSH